MIWRIFLLYLYVMALNICTGDDFDDGHCKTYIEIKNLTDYRNPDWINDLSKRPLGFQSASIPFLTINPNARNPCFKISLENSTQKTVELLAKSTVGNTVFCVKSQPPYAQPTCQSGIKTCQDSPIGHDSLKYVFYCPSCDAELTIWFRLTISPSFTDGLDFEHWCQREAEYPDSLITLPSEPTTKQQTTSKASQMFWEFRWYLSVCFAFNLILALN
ncbi:uncharacterized protein LOC114522028 [Dendronephthya gigantea]|uniref:uncharacterized protein LOC114522028 n=1 Tax=Dendronephthya gigantea TaxID=151771 RepID=UPI00106A2BF9|nr:uncharacterized protein LOC114522028 [Dendronephthya gigantea]